MRIWEEVVLLGIFKEAETRAKDHLETKLMRAGRQCHGWER